MKFSDLKETLVGYGRGFGRVSLVVFVEKAVRTSCSSMADESRWRSNSRSHDPSLSTIHHSLLFLSRAPSFAPPWSAAGA